MLYYKEHFMHFSKLRFYYMNKLPRYILPNALRFAIGQLKVSSHQLEIKNGHVNGVRREERICWSCHIEIEDEYHFTCKWSSYVEIRAKYHAIVGPPPTPSKLLDTLDIKTLGRSILELKQHRENKLQNVNHNLSNIQQHVANEISQNVNLTCLFKLTILTMEINWAQFHPLTNAQCQYDSNHLIRQYPKKAPNLLNKHNSKLPSTGKQ